MAEQYTYSQQGGRVLEITAKHREWIDRLVERDRLIPKIAADLNEIRNNIHLNTHFDTAQKLYAVLVKIEKLSD